MKTTLETASLRVEAETIRAYAEMTNDFNPIHLDADFASKTAMGGVIAHGTMSICLLMQALARNFGSDVFNDMDLDIRFVSPVRIGEVLTAKVSPLAEGDELIELKVLGTDGSDRLRGTLRRIVGGESK